MFAVILVLKYNAMIIKIELLECCLDVFGKKLYNS